LFLSLWIFRLIGRARRQAEEFENMLHAVFTLSL